MDLTLSESELAFQAEAGVARGRTCRPSRSVDGHRGGLPRPPGVGGDARRGALVGRVLAQEYDGRGASLVEWVIFEEEYYRAGAPGRVSQNGIFLLAPILFDHGTDGAAGPLPADDGDRRAGLGAGMVRARGRLRPGLADRRPRAATTSAAAGCSTARRPGRRGRRTPHWGFGLFRSDPEAQRHHGLTYFLFPLDADGVTVRPIAQLDGEAGFAEIFLEDVFVPDSDVLGAPGDGWRVAMSTAGNERGLSLRSPGRFCAAADRLVELYRERGGFETGARTPDGRG